MLHNCIRSEILVEWSGSKNREHFPALAPVGASFIRVVKPTIGGHYFPAAFPVLNIPFLRFEMPIIAMSSLYDAVKRGDLRAIKLLCNQHGVDVNTLCNQKKPALVLACKEGHKHLVEWLLDQVQIDLEKPDNNGYRAVHRAVQRYKIFITVFLMRFKNNIM